MLGMSVCRHVYVPDVRRIVSVEKVMARGARFWGEAPPVEVRDEARSRHPDERCRDDDGANDVIAQEQQHLVDVDVLDYVPEPFDDVLDRLLTDALLNPPN